MTIHPLHDRILIKRLDEEAQTPGGLYIPEQAKEKPIRGTVIAVGPGKVQDGQLVEPKVKRGDVVLFSKYGGVEVKLDGEEHLIMREEELLAVIAP